MRLKSIKGITFANKPTMVNPAALIIRVDIEGLLHQFKFFCMDLRQSYKWTKGTRHLPSLLLVLISSFPLSQREERTLVR